MSSNELGYSKYSKNYCIPFYWSKSVDPVELKDYFLTLRTSQVILKTLHTDRLEEDDAIIVKEVYSRRSKLIDYIHYISDSYTFKNETSFKAVQVFDHFLHKLLVTYLTSSKSEDDQSANITKKFADFVNYMTVYAVLCLNIACKIEEINCNYLSFFNDNLLKKKFTFTIEELNRRETEILKFLNFRTCMPTPFQFGSTFFQILINEVFAGESNQLGLSELIIKLINKNSELSKVYSAYSESMYNSPLTSGLICFKAAMVTLSKTKRVDLTALHERFNLIILDYLRNEDYLKKIDQEAYKVYLKVMKLQKVGAGVKDESMGC